MLHPTKTKGDLGVLKAQLDLTEKGYIVSWQNDQVAGKKAEE